VIYSAKISEENQGALVMVGASGHDRLILKVVGLSLKLTSK